MTDDVVTLVAAAERAVRQEYGPTEAADPQPLTSLLVWLKLSKRGLTRQQWQQLVSKVPTPFPVTALKFHGMSMWIEHCARCPVVMVLPSDWPSEGPAAGKLRCLDEPAHPAVNLQLGAGPLDPDVLGAFKRYVAKQAAAVGDGPPFMRPDLLLWDGAAYICDNCQWANSEIRMVEGRLGYSERALRSRVWVQRLNRGRFFIPLPLF